MKKILLIIVCLFILLTGCSRQEKNEIEIFDDSLRLELVKSIGCSNKVFEYYQKNGHDRVVYFVCLDEIYVKRENTKQITLKYHFDNINQSFDTSIEQIIEQMDFVDVYYDGGSKIYRKDDYKILVCNTLDGNRDIYFGDISLEYKEEYCKG